MESMQPVVSIIIPVYNSERYLAQTLDSVLAVSPPLADMEVVLVDDGSTDRSLEIARDYAARYGFIRVLEQPNAGPVRARNNAVEHARGRYIFPLDSDDLLVPDFLAEAVGVLDREPEVKVVAGRNEFFGGRKGPWRLPEFSLRLLARRNLICVSALYRREDWVRVGGYCEEIVALEDWDFWISVLKEGGRVVTLDGAAIRYRIRPGSKRVRDRAWKHHVVDTLNRRHAAFFERELCGPLHYQRTWSRPLNRLRRLLGLKREKQFPHQS